MKKILLIVCCIYSFQIFAQKKIEILSPKLKTKIVFELIGGKPYYAVINDSKVITKSSLMGFELKDGTNLSQDLTLISKKYSKKDTVWQPVWGQQKNIIDQHNEMTLFLKHKSGMKLNISFAAFDDGAAFRYQIEGKKDQKIDIIKENTEINLATNSNAWWIPAYQKLSCSYESFYKNTKISEIDTAHTPITFENISGKTVSIHEANLTDFAAMTLFSNHKNGNIYVDLVPWSDGIKVKAVGKTISPWRLILIADKAGDLVTNNIMLNLNEPNKIADAETWVKPMKYIGIWWGMHTGVYTWSEGPKHGASSENTKRYIDFAAANGFTEVLNEGWQKGFDTDWSHDYGSKMSFIAPCSDYNLDEAQNYAKSKGVTVQGYHETCSNPENYFNQIDSAFNLMKRLGYKSAKIGHVGYKFQGKEWHDGQFGVNYYRKVLLKGVENKININFHEPIKGTGEWRTYPNMMSREGARGMEYNAWSPDGGNPPSHDCILPFTRLISGPMEYTPGIFDLTIPEMPNNCVQSTLARQLALYLVMYSPIQMAADLPEHYEGHPAFEFIKKVPVDWSDTKVLNGEIGKFYTVARKDKKSENWFLGSITNEESRNLKIDFSFLDKDAKYEAIIYKDGIDAHYKTNPQVYQIENRMVTNKDVFELQLAPGGGAAISFIKK